MRQNTSSIKNAEGQKPGQSLREKSGKYLYAVMDGAARHEIYGPIGIDEGVVSLISDGRVSAAVSDVPNEKIRPERRHLAAHQGVLKRLMEGSTVLPMAFGIIADDVKGIQKILSNNQEVFLKQLHRVAGKVEMGVRVMWDVPNIFEYFVNTHAELRTARDRLFGAYREPSHEDKIEIGRMFDRIINEDRQIHAEKVEKVLSSQCVEIKSNPVRNEREVINLACLIERDAQKQFEDGVFEAAKLFDDNFTFDFNGPWAPHNFVKIDLNL